MIMSNERQDEYIEMMRETYVKLNSDGAFLLHSPDKPSGEFTFDNLNSVRTR